MFMLSVCVLSLIRVDDITLIRIDVNIVAVALPSMVQDLGGQDLYAWVISAYLLTSSSVMALYGAQFVFVYALLEIIINCVQVDSVMFTAAGSY